MQMMCMVNDLSRKIQWREYLCTIYFIATLTVKLVTYSMVCLCSCFIWNYVLVWRWSKSLFLYGFNVLTFYGCPLEAYDHWRKNAVRQSYLRSTLKWRIRSFLCPFFTSKVSASVSLLIGVNTIKIPINGANKLNLKSMIIYYRFVKKQCPTGSYNSVLVVSMLWWVQALH